MATNIYKTIEFLSANLEKIRSNFDKKVLGFAEQQIEKYQKYGEKYYCSPRQRGFLRSVEARLHVLLKTGEKPKSKLDELREKRRKILKRISKDNDLVARGNQMTAADVPSAIIGIANASNDAAMRHSRSKRMQIDKLEKII